MKFSEQWLREWVNPALDTQALCEQLSMAGLEVDSVAPAAPAFDNVVVARVESVEPHPDADRLRICQVNDGGKNLLPVVCGAANVAANMHVVLARVGAELPGGMKIKPARLRGVDSAGMLCSAVEIGLAEQSEGLMELPADAPLGTCLREYLNLDDPIIDIDLTPNRGDCLSMLGIAREVAALNQLSVTLPELSESVDRHDEQRTVEIQEPQACQSYVGRVIKGIDAQSSTPQWMVERLRRSGIRAIHPVVDVTNYVLIELGQPMHAFDQAKLQGTVLVRLAGEGEKLQALTGESLELSDQDLVIADSTGPIALAGVVGGTQTAVDNQSTGIFLEAACFVPKIMAGTARRHKVHTDSSHRFERGVDPKGQTRAMERATRLIVEICGGEPGPVITVGKGADAVEPILLRKQRATRLLGFELESEQIESIMRGLDMQLESAGEGQWHILPPSYRYDIRIEADLIEELVRITGYDKLPTRPQQVVLPAMQMSERKVSLARLREALIQRDYQEAITYSFVDAEQQRQLLPALEAINLDNPIAQQLAQMRGSLWASLLPAVLHNQQRQQERIRLFELGLRFERDNNDVMQEPMLAAIVTGPRVSEQWGSTDDAADYYDVKADVESLLAMGGLLDDVEFRAAEHPALHPGKSACISRAGHTIGWIGELHPRLRSVYDLNTSPVLFELELRALQEAEVPEYQPTSDFPGMRRDLALVVDEAIMASELIRCIQEAGESLLTDIQVFDVYRGKGLPSGCKSVALGLNFQDKSRTLQESEVEEAVKRLESRLSEKLGATIRG